jgi:hypothetical protein
MSNSIVARIALGFIAGAFGVLVFHQGFIEILHLAGLLPNEPYSFKPTAPWQIPQVLSLAFWGGLWGIALVFCLEALRSAERLWAAFLFGGVFPPLVGMLIVAPLKGTSVDWTDWHRLAVGFLINGVWGLGTGLVYLMERRALRARTAS